MKYDPKKFCHMFGVIFQLLEMLFSIIKDSYGEQFFLPGSLPKEKNELKILGIYKNEPTILIPYYLLNKFCLLLC